MEDGEIVNIEEQSDFCASEESYRSILSSDEEGNAGLGYEGEFYFFDQNNPMIEVGAQYPNAIAFRRALCHYAITKDFEYTTLKSDQKRVTAKCANLECFWRIHASVSDDDVTFVVRSLRGVHTCSGVNKRGNKHANEGWVADRIIDELRSDGNTAVKELKKKLESRFGIKIPYLKVWRGKELAMEEMHGKWTDSFMQIAAFKEEITRRNPGSIVALGTEDRHFQRFFIAFEACRTGFLIGCRPYIGIDACHLKGRWKGVLAAATAVDGNNWMYPVAFAVMENESEVSWTWFLRNLHEALGVAPMPSKDEWVKYDLGYKLLPPLMKRPAGRPRKRRMKASDETRKKRSNKCSRCGLVGHHKNTCKNPVPLEHEGASQITQESTNISGGNKGKKRSQKKACMTNLFKILQEERI